LVLRKLRSYFADLRAREIAPFFLSPIFNTVIPRDFSPEESASSLWTGAYLCHVSADARSISYFRCKASTKVGSTARKYDIHPRRLAICSGESSLRVSLHTSDFSVRFFSRPIEIFRSDVSTSPVTSLLRLRDEKAVFSLLMRRTGDAAVASELRTLSKILSRTLGRFVEK
jgi:hypothetical protein